MSGDYSYASGCTQSFEEIVRTTDFSGILTLLFLLIIIGAILNLIYLLWRDRKKEGKKG